MHTQKASQSQEEKRGTGGHGGRRGRRGLRASGGGRLRRFPSVGRRTSSRGPGSAAPTPTADAAVATSSTHIHRRSASRPGRTPADVAQPGHPATDRRGRLSATVASYRESDVLSFPSASSSSDVAFVQKSRWHGLSNDGLERTPGPRPERRIVPAVSEDDGDGGATDRGRQDPRVPGQERHGCHLSGAGRIDQNNLNESVQW